MRNIFLFIRRYFTFLFFLVLQILALSFLFRYNKYHEAAFMGVANELTGHVSTRYNNIEYYFRLKKTNDELARGNEQLLNQLKQDYQVPDTSRIMVRDTIANDTLGRVRKYVWRVAKVVNNSVGLQNNYITIHRGEAQGVRKDMGVISSGGIVGTVINTSTNFAVVMSLLHRQSHVSARLKKTGELGLVQWDGESPLYVTMVNVPKSVTVNKGDTVVTSQYSYLFPEGVMIGTVADVVNDQTSNFYTMRLKPSNNFYSMEYVYVVENTTKEEQKKLEDATKKIQ